MASEGAQQAAVRRRPRKPVPFLVRISGRFYWQPTRAVRDLGFANEALGAERLAAMARAVELNRGVAEARQKRAQPSNTGYWIAVPSGTPLHPLTGKPKGTVDDVVALYYRDHKKFLSKAEKTQKGYRYNIGRILEWCGGTMVAHIDRPSIKAWQVALEESAPLMAASILRTLRILMGVAKDWGYIDANPAEKLGLATARPVDSECGEAFDPEEDILWAADEVERFCRTAVAENRKSVADALMLGLNLGQREGDILRLRWDQYDEETGLVLIRPRKVARMRAGVVVSVPVTPDLKAWLDAMPRPDDRSKTMVVREAGSARFQPGPYREDYFRAKVAEIREKAKLRPELKFRYTRHTAATRLGEAGCTPHEIMAITGHTQLETVMKYVKPNPSMAMAAMAKLQEARARLEVRLKHGSVDAAMGQPPLAGQENRSP